MLRLMLSTDPVFESVLRVMPLHLRREVADVLRRQRKLVKDECMPCNVPAPWVQELFKDIVRLKKAQWRTSATGKQESSMVHKFLRATGWMELPFNSLDGFKLYIMNEVNIDTVVDMCMGYLQKFCAEEASRRRYRPALGKDSNHQVSFIVKVDILHNEMCIIEEKLTAQCCFKHIFQLLFVTYFQKLTKENFGAIVESTIPEYETLADLDDRLSTSTRNTEGGRKVDQRKYFTQDEMDKLMGAQLRILDRLVVAMLETTGLRRRGLVNVLIRDIAHQDPDSER